MKICMAKILNYPRPARIVDVLDKQKSLRFFRLSRLPHKPFILPLIALIYCFASVITLNALYAILNKASAAPQDACETLKVVSYDANTVTPVRAKRGFATQIILGPGETILDKRGGDSDGWEVASLPGSNLAILTIKPRSMAEHSNLIVTTTQRIYVMSLLVEPDNSRCKGVWQLVFSIPPPPAVAVIRETPEQAAAKRVAKLKDALKAVPEITNTSYSMQVLPGSEDITPNEVYDDGRFTFIRFSGNRELPSVFRISSDGEEVIPDRHMKTRDVMVIHEVARRWVLRLDKQVIGIWNDAFDPEGVPPVAGTISEKVQRLTNGQEFGDE